METPMSRKQVAELLCRGLPKSKVYSRFRMSKGTFNRRLREFCVAASLPMDTNIWIFNKDSILRNVEKYEQYLQAEIDLRVKFRQSLEITDKFTGKSSTHIPGAYNTRGRLEELHREDDDLLS